MKATQKGLNILKVKKVMLNNIYEIFPLIDVLLLYEIEQDSSNVYNRCSPTGGTHLI